MFWYCPWSILSILIKKCLGQIQQHASGNRILGHRKCLLVIRTYRARKQPQLRPRRFQTTVTLTPWRQNPKVHHRVHKSPLPVPIMRLNPLHTPPASLSLIPSFPSTLRSSELSLSFGFSDQNITAARIQYCRRVRNFVHKRFICCSENCILNGESSITMPTTFQSSTYQDLLFLFYIYNVIFLVVNA
jgi:hypothetical protein